MLRPTYTTIEILDFLCRLDLDELAILGELVTDESDRYTIRELSIIHANFQRQVFKVVKRSACKVMEQIWKFR